MKQREEMENALKIKINSIVQKIETGKEREEELKEKIKNNYDQAEKEESIVMELHAKLQSLEATLRKKERDYDSLKNEYFDAQVEADSVEEYWRREENQSMDDIEKGNALRREYGDVLIENNQLKVRSQDVMREITKMEQQLCEEESLRDKEEERVEGLQVELEKITDRLNTVITRQEELQKKDIEQRKKLDHFKQKHVETESKANQMEFEVKEMESTLERLTETLAAMKIEQKKLETMLYQEKNKLENEEETNTRKNEYHKAQNISLPKKILKNSNDNHNIEITL
ncbi:reticulocyte-binding protein homolog 2a-like [Hydractinia symbiolongicarpus]|uniref:reticulocyte-binding protein homolog 2a-like n=1 Tax=Hydractinia symbiolongicarpus TaxID=13093 RepID=UPI0025519873|nr:reticulocyte-binding protein homolog 2a-like [Hydractinia symbiolongicarpus]XP_057309525.1 reticulocyte-binding protein homolog 2a-like [Hydractinia symbiolongicarpus]